MLWFLCGYFPKTLCVRPFKKLNLILNALERLKRILSRHVSCFNGGFLVTKMQAPSVERMLGQPLFKAWILSSGLSDQWPPHHPLLLVPEASLDLLLPTQLLLAGLTLTRAGLWDLGSTCWLTSVLGPGMHGALIAEWSLAPGTSAAWFSVPSCHLPQVLARCPSTHWTPLPWSGHCLCPACWTASSWEPLALQLCVLLEQHCEIVSRGLAPRGCGVLRLAVKQTCHIDFLLC